MNRPYRRRTVLFVVLTTHDLIEMLACMWTPVCFEFLGCHFVAVQKAVHVSFNSATAAAFSTMQEAPFGFGRTSLGCRFMLLHVVRTACRASLI